MKIVLPIRENIQTAMRRCGYVFIKEENGELAFVRPLSSSGSGYPRFHIYVNIGEFPRGTSFNLHLDQKKPVYQGVSAHAGEYEGEIVEKEAARIKKILGL